MIGTRILRHAEIQARVRARLARQPDARAWYYIIESSDIDNVIERMRATGLAFWVAGMPRSPTAAAIEQHLMFRVGDFLASWVRLFPAHWKPVTAWVDTARQLLRLARVLHAADPGLPADIVPALRAIAVLPVDDRLSAARGSVYAPYVGERGVDWMAWLDDFRRVCPRASGREAYVVARIGAALDDHFAAVAAARSAVYAQHGEVSEDAQWRLRDRLAEDLRALLGGDPFHTGLTLIYGLLEMIQLERCRAVLSAFARGWEVPLVVRRTA